MPGLPRATPARMAEFNDWKFGLMIHFGPWSQTGRAKIWEMVRRPPEERDPAWPTLNTTFDPKTFDPSAWARAAKAAGMTYAIFTTKHHDGFCLWPTRTTDFSVAGADCPVSRWDDPDIVRRVADAMRAEGLRYGHYYSHIDWHEPRAQRFSMQHPLYDPDAVQTDPEAWARFVDYEIAQVEELLTGYGEIELIWWDIAWPMRMERARDMPVIIRQPYADPDVAASLERLIARVRALAPLAIMNERGVQPYGDYISPEQEIPEDPPEGPWETAMTVTGPGRREVGGFWWQGEDALYKSTHELILSLAQTVSRGGNFCLNVAPDADGVLPPEEVERLAEMGAWMAVNAEAIYGSRAGGVTAPWGVTTRKGEALYLIVFERPAPGEALRVPGVTAKAATLLGGGELAMASNGEDLLVAWPEGPGHPVADVVRLAL